MIEYARGVFRSLQKTDDGSDASAHYRQLRKARKKLGRPERNPGEEHAEDIEHPPLGTEHIWSAFLDLHSTRSSGFSANPVSYSEIASYVRLVGIPLTSWEVSLIRRIDSAVLSVFNEGNRNDGGYRGTRTRTPVEGRDAS